MADPVRVRRLTDHEGRRLRRAMVVLASAGGNTVPRSPSSAPRPGKNPTIPDRDVKLARIEHVSSKFPARVFAFDEFGTLTIRPRLGADWARKGHPDQLPANYHNLRGVRQFHGCYSVGDDTLAALKSIRTARPDGAPICVILDNLSAHRGTAIRAWSARHKVELCFTSTYSSWANPIEAHFGRCAPS